MGSASSAASREVTSPDSPKTRKDKFKKIGKYYGSHMRMALRMYSKLPLRLYLTIRKENGTELPEPTPEEEEDISAEEEGMKTCLPNEILNIVFDAHMGNVHKVEKSKQTNGEKENDSDGQCKGFDKCEAFKAEVLEVEELYYMLKFPEGKSDPALQEILKSKKYKKQYINVDEEGNHNFLL
uniref:Uncharacterized protein TCIL3000_1_90 n=1 Tax=Trypanosoma congolense (strain IL3000) TaxID=1068625 RepID=G0UIQ1_TRYCI|nr:unnamed protein product [Trypanosoma congolense IL3000]